MIDFIFYVLNVLFSYMIFIGAIYLLTKYLSSVPPISTEIPDPIDLTKSPHMKAEEDSSNE